VVVRAGSSYPGGTGEKDGDVALEIATEPLVTFSQQPCLLKMGSGERTWQRSWGRLRMRSRREREQHEAEYQDGNFEEHGERHISGYFVSGGLKGKKIGCGNEVAG
jgi:hypothetical protein